MSETVGLMKTAFRDLSGGRATVPHRLGIEMPEGKGRSLLMPVYMPSAGQLSVKVVSLFRENPSRGLPYIQSLLVLVDGRNGEPLALMDGAYLTSLRTGAASGLATQVLSRTNSSTLMVFGAGGQSRHQIEGVCAVREIRRTLVFDPSTDRAGRLCEALKGNLPCDFVVARSPAEVEKADVVCTATTSQTSVLDDGHVRPGTHMNAIGAYRPEMCEIPPETVARSLVVVDSRAAALAEAGDIIQAVAAGKFHEERIHAELGEIIEGSRPGRGDDVQITLFKSVGNALQDLVAAGRALENARRLGLGTTIDM